MNMQKTFFPLAMALGLISMAQAQSSNEHPTHEGPSVSIPAADIGFGATGVKSNGLELKAGPAYGNLAKGRHGTFVRMPAGYKSAIHTHTEDYYAVVVEGVGANFPAGATGKPLPVGSYFFQRGEEAHETQCLSKEDCLFFIVQPGKFDYVIAK